MKKRIYCFNCSKELPIKYEREEWDKELRIEVGLCPTCQEENDIDTAYEEGYEHGKDEAEEETMEEISDRIYCFKNDIKKEFPESYEQIVKILKNNDLR